MRVNKTIYLVGAGPGDPELLTVRAAKLIRMAEVIVFDGLVGPEILSLADKKAELISVAKKRSNHTLPQKEINALLVAKALEGRRVVRLKGGDPLVFGRGGEEAEDIRSAGLSVEIVPGITAALGAASASQIALTHRSSSSIVSFVAGQCKGLSDQDWTGLAGKGRTLVIYMGVKTAPQIAEKLIADGLAPDMPIAVIENASLPRMRVIHGLLASLPKLVEAHCIKSPSLIVIGEVTARSDLCIKKIVEETL